jgi:hypothetical protein
VENIAPTPENALALFRAGRDTAQIARILRLYRRGPTSDRDPNVDGPWPDEAAVIRLLEAGRFYERQLEQIAREVGL